MIFQSTVEILLRPSQYLAATKLWEEWPSLWPTFSWGEEVAAFTVINLQTLSRESYAMESF